MNSAEMRRKVRSVNGLDVIVVHLGVYDLKHMSTIYAIQELRGVLLHLVQTTAAKIMFSLVLPIGHRVNKAAIDLITGMRKDPRLIRRISTIFKDGPTKK